MVPYYVALAILVPLVSFLIAKLCTNADTEIEDRRRHAIKLAGILRNLGCVRLAELAEDYAVGDWSAIAKKFYKLLKLVLSGDQAVVGELNQAFERVLDAKIATPDGRQWVSDKLDGTVKKAADAVSAVVKPIS